MTAEQLLDLELTFQRVHVAMSYSLNSLKVVIWGITWGSIEGFIKRDTGSLDYGSYSIYLSPKNRKQMFSKGSMSLCSAGFKVQGLGFRILGR